MKAFTAFLDSRFGGSLRRMAHADTMDLREQLLQIHGIGPETADCILLNAADQSSFVVDAYTRRVLSRHGICASDLSYEALQQLIKGAIERDLNLYQQYHALLAQVQSSWSGGFHSETIFQTDAPKSMRTAMAAKGSPKA